MLSGLSATQEKNQEEPDRFVPVYMGGRNAGKHSETFEKAICQNLAGRRSDPSASEDNALPTMPSGFLKAEVELERNVVHWLTSCSISIKQTWEVLLSLHFSSPFGISCPLLFLSVQIS